MKRFRRILFNNLTAISLLLALATAGLWASSLSYFPGIHRSSGEIHQTLFAQNGVLLLVSDEKTSDMDVEGAIESQTRWSLVNRDEWGLIVETWGFAIPRLWRPASRVWGKANRLHLFAIPLSQLLILCVALPALRGALLLRGRKRFLHAHCPACGYDIRTNPAKCSECGQEPTFAGDRGR